jgi:predicted dehydrogenase
MEPRPHVKGNTTVNDEREDHFLATLNFASGLMGVWSYCTSAPGHSFTHVVYYGSEGCLLDQGDVFHGPFSRGEVILKDGTHIPMTQLQEEFRASLGEEGNRRLFPHDWTDGVTLEVYDYMTAIRDGRAPEVDGATGLKAKTIAETIYESAHCGQAVRYADVLSGKVDAYQREIDQKWGL